MWESLFAVFTIFFGVNLPYQKAIRDLNFVVESETDKFYWFVSIFYILDLFYNMVVP
jgi:hypothetical protein